MDRPPPPSVISISSLLWYLDKSFDQEPRIWKYNVDICADLPSEWNRDTTMFVFCYIFQFISNLEHDRHSHFTDATASVIMDLEKVATFLRHKIYTAENTSEYCKPPAPTYEIQSKQVELSKMLVSSFFPDVVVPRFFTVPKMHHLSQTDQQQLHANEIIAAFIDFLLQVLYHQTNIGEAEVKRWALMRKELSFLLALLGDIPFQCTHLHHDFLQQTNALLAEFEALANVAGRMVYDAVFPTHQMEANEFHAKAFGWIKVLVNVAGSMVYDSVFPNNLVEANEFHAITLAWVEKIENLNAKIKEHCFKFSELPMSVISRSRVVDSFFIIHSLIEDIENLKNHSLNFIHDDEIMEQMRTLHDELTLSRSFIKVIQDNEEKEVLVQIRDLTYEAEYLINSLVAGNMQVWYLKIRLPSITHNIEIANGKVSFQSTGNLETMAGNNFLDFNLNIAQRILMDVSEDMKASEVGYRDLRSEIKPCFLYFAAFPKDSEISQKKLTSLWISEGFIQKQGNKSLEETAEMYLLYLIDRKFVLIVETGRNGAIKRCKMHSPLHDFCARKANEENFIKFTNGFSMYEKCQRLCVAATESWNSWRPFGLHCRSYRDLRTPQKSSCFQTMPLLKVLHRSPLEERYSCPAASTFPRQLRTLSYVCFNGKKDEDILRCWPHLRKLKCRVTNHTRRYPDVSFLGELESLKISYEGSVIVCILSSEYKFPLTIKKLCLDGGELPWEMMSIIGRLPNLQDLKLKQCAFWGVVWETRDGEFQKLKCLKLFKCRSLRLWMSCSEHFPVLECLVLEECMELCGIPLDFGNIPTLKTIRVIGSTDNAGLSALHIGKQIQVFVEDRWGKDIVQELRNGSRRRSELMNVLSLMEEYGGSGSQQGFINKLPTTREYLRRKYLAGRATLCWMLFDLMNHRPTTELRMIDQTEDQTTTTTADIGDDEERMIFSCNHQTYFVVISFAMHFSLDQEEHAFSDTVMVLRCIAESYKGRKYWLPARHPRYVDEIKKTRTWFLDMLINSFIPQVQGFFQLPKIEQFSKHKGDKHLKKNEILASFMDFLLQILFSEIKTGSPGAGQYALLHKELSFLRALMGDIPFQPTDHPQFHDQVNSLLTEFEMLANEIGGFLFTSVFPSQPINGTRHHALAKILKANIKKHFSNFSMHHVSAINGSRFHAETNALLGVVKILSAKINEHCTNFSKLPVSAILRSNVVDSFFIVESFIEDLQGIIMNGQLGNFTPDDAMMEKMKELQGQLKLSQSFFEFIRENDSDEKKEGLIQIRDLSYEAEYLINSLGVGSIHVWYLNLRLPSIISKIKIACIGLEQISERENASDVKVSYPITGNTATIDVNQILDFNDGTSQSILEHLTRKSNTSRRFISIFGMAGLGKTTTASKLYNGRAASSHFDRRAWCVVSENYDVRGLFNQILVGLGNASIAPEENDARAGEEIHKTLYRRRYLIVLDDVWHPEVLDSLIRYFPDDGNGSRVLITTRNKDVCPTGSSIYELPFLSEDQCWNLLEKKVFKNGPCPPHLVSIGKRIAARCSGVPLAVVSIAGVLVNVEKEESEWERVEGGVNTILLGDQSDYRKIMDVSYHHLPHYIKPCFLSFAGYPEDAEISTKELIRFWMAQGFIQKDGKKRPEDIAEMYLLDLINRSLVMIGKTSSGGGIKTCRIHDLLRDLCIKQADEDNFFNSTKLFSIYNKHQHLCHPSSSNSNRRPSGLHCRSLRCHVDQSSGIHTMPLLKAVVLFGDEVKVDFWYNHPFNFNGSWDNHPVVDLPCQLRYLGIVGEVIISKRILDNLVDLEFFHVRTQKYEVVVHIPPVILKMAKLRHLSVRDKLKFEGDSSDSIPERTNLRYLSLVVIETKKDEEILRNSPHLQTLKCTVEGKQVPDLSSHAELESLRMHFKYSIKHVVEVKFLPSTIKKLCLSYCGLPWEKMSIIGQLPKLEVLKLETYAFVGEEWETKDDEFMELKYLKIDRTKLKYWISESCHFPSLECLVLSWCEDLVEIPSDFGTIETLMEIRLLELCSKEAYISGICIEEQQREFGNQELKVNITSSCWTKEELIQEAEAADEQSNSSL